MSQRNDIWDALVAHLRSDAGVAALVTSVSQGLEHWKDVPHGQCPRLTVVDTTADPVGGGWGKPNLWQPTFMVYVYTKSSHSDGSAQRRRNDVIDAVCASLDIAPALKRQTLGGAVFDCRISGKIETDNGSLGAESVGWFPVTVRPTA